MPSLRSLRGRTKLVTAAATILLLCTAGWAVGWTLLLARELRGRRAVERALYGEVLALRGQAAVLAQEIARRYKAGEAFDARFFELWTLSAPQIYPSTGAAHLGLLPREAMGCVGLFYGQLADARERLRRARTDLGFQPTPYRVLSGLVRSHYGVDPWLRRVGARLGVGPGADLDISAANQLLGELEEAGDEPLAMPYGWVDCCEAPEEGSVLS